jgi:hypothetical protein
MRQNTAVVPAGRINARGKVSITTSPHIGKKPLIDGKDYRYR